MVMCGTVERRSKVSERGEKRLREMRDVPV